MFCLRSGVPGEEVTAPASVLACGAGEWACADRSRCVPAAWRCDTHTHCPDASDEIGCGDRAGVGAGVRRGRVGVRGPLALRAGRLALRHPHALPDASDEIGCGQYTPHTMYTGPGPGPGPGEEVTAPASVLACGAGEWACADRSRCVPAAWRCDTHTHCPDASDEIGCGQYTPHTMYTGPGPGPGPGEEVTAPASVLACGAGEWACADRSRCVPAAWRCDTHTHCPDASDEIGCGQYTPHTMYTGPGPGPGPGEEVTAPASVLACGAGEWACADRSRCVPAAWRCDTHTHCPDASDEIGCVFPNTTCSGGQFRCAHSGLCIAATWRCDGEDDCGPHDNSDEDVYMCNKDLKCPANSARCATPEGGHFQCVPVGAFCDGKRDCRDGSDEWDQCAKYSSESCADLNCARGCRATLSGLACFCEPGFEPHDGRCDDPESQPLSLLVATEHGLQRVTPSPSPSPSLVPSLVLTPSPSPPTNRTALQALHVRAFDFLYSNKSVCYVHHNVSRAGLVCVDADDLSRRRNLPTPDLFPDIDSVSYVRVDWVSGSWYLYDWSRSVLYVCSASMQHCRVLLQHRLSRMHGLALDPTAGFMFWSVWGGAAAALERGDLSGGGRAALAAHRLVYPSGVCVDIPARRVYWADAYLDTLECARYDGEQRRTLARLPTSQNVHQLSVLGSVVYAPDLSGSILGIEDRPPLAGGAGGAGGAGARAEPTPVIKLSGKGLAVAVYHRQAQPVVSHPCARDNGGCDHICVTSHRGRTAYARCLCSHGYRLHSHGDCLRVEMSSYLVLARGTPPMVQALPIPGVAGEGGGGGGGGGGTQRSEVPLDAAAPATHLTRPSTAAVDIKAGMLYYCDVHRYEIVRQRLDGGGREVFINEDVDNCEGLAIDWMSGLLYWTDAALGRISAARLSDARLRVTLISGPMDRTDRTDRTDTNSSSASERRDYSPRSIALHPQRGWMFWSVWGGAGGQGGAIERAALGGLGRRVLVGGGGGGGLHWPAGLTVHYDTERLYWCDTYLNKIERLDLASNKRELVVADSPSTPVLKPYGLALYQDSILWSEHESGAVRRRDGRGAVTVAYDLPAPLYDLTLVSDTITIGENACSRNNGGCSELCISAERGTQCACAAPRHLAPDGRACGPPSARGGAGGAAVTAPPSPCLQGHFHCGKGRCIDSLYVCDGDTDCPDGSDEDSSPDGPCANVTCDTEHFMQCDKHRCIPKSWVCDGTKDCTDGWDESRAACARAQCGADQFACARSKRCVPAAWRCDRATDCGPDDDSDEREWFYK
ncbi:hypothetical protein evm_013527 [Chilo suppressalis]|nr:hypothetical protein evm_013527 [Chilo suppressalis]